MLIFNFMDFIFLIGFLFSLFFFFLFSFLLNGYWYRRSLIFFFSLLIFNGIFKCTYSTYFHVILCVINLVLEGL